MVYSRPKIPKNIIHKPKRVVLFIAVVVLYKCVKTWRKQRFTWKVVILVQPILSKTTIICAWNWFIVAFLAYLKCYKQKRQAFIITTKQTRKVIAFTIFSETPRISLSYIYGCNLILPHFRLSKKRLLERFSLYIFYKNLQFHKGLCCFVYLFWCWQLGMRSGSDVGNATREAIWSVLFMALIENAPDKM